MTGYAINIEVPEGRVKEILDKMTAAQNTIYECYSELERLGVVTVREKETAPAPEAKGRQDANKTAEANDREWLIREYERRLALLKSGASPGDVIFQV